MQPAAQSAEGTGIAQAYGQGATANVHITGFTSEQLQEAVRAGGEAHLAIINDLSRQLETTKEAVRGFFNILRVGQVPIEKLQQRLEEIAQRHRDMLQRLAALEPDTPEARACVEEARKILRVAETQDAYDRADALFAEVETLDLRALRAAEALEREAKEAARKKRLSAAATRAERGELNLTRLDYLRAGLHFKAAAEIVGEPKLRAIYLARFAGALRQYGDHSGDNAVLAEAINVYRAMLTEIPRNEAPLDWAIVRNNLGVALGTLGSRDAGKDRLEEAVIALREALHEFTRAGFVGLIWGATQDSLGNALGALGARESGTERLEQAVSAFEEALKERTRARAPLIGRRHRTTSAMRLEG